MIKELSISGFRGFGQAQTVKFSIPDQESVGSGLTIITGANNAGKTTIIESIRAFNGTDSPSFSEGRRNNLTGGKVTLTLTDEESKTYSIVSVEGGVVQRKRMKTSTCNFMFYPPDGQFLSILEKGVWNRETYISYSQTLELNAVHL